MRACIAEQVVLQGDGGNRLVLLIESKELNGHRKKEISKKKTNRR